MTKTKSAGNNVCENCGEKSNDIKVVTEIVDRFQVEEVRACPKCAKQINKESAMFAN